MFSLSGQGCASRCRGRTIRRGSGIAQYAGRHGLSGLTWRGSPHQRSIRCWEADLSKHQTHASLVLGVQRVSHRDTSHWILARKVLDLSSGRWSDWSWGSSWPHRGWIYRRLGGNCASRDGWRTLALHLLEPIPLQTFCGFQRSLPLSHARPQVSVASPCSIVRGLVL